VNLTNDKGLDENPETGKPLPSVKHDAMLRWIRSTGADIDPRKPRERAEASALRSACVALRDLAHKADEAAQLQTYPGQADWYSEEADRNAVAIERLRKILNK